MALIAGGVLGLRPVPTSLWSGLPLSFILTAVGLALGFPLGVVLALARAPLQAAGDPHHRHRLHRGHPRRAADLDPVHGLGDAALFMPAGMTVDKLLRAQIAIIIFAGAYIAEAVRGGLQAIPRGQHEAAGALGLHYWQSMRLIVLPQAR